MAGSDLKPIRQPESAVAQVYAHRLCEKTQLSCFCYYLENVFQIYNVKND